RRNRDGRPPPRLPRLPDEGDEQRDHPGGPEDRPEDSGLRTHLGVVRLAGLDRSLGARRRLAGVAEAVALGMMDHGSRTVAQARQMVAKRGLVGTDRVCRPAWVLLGLGMLI